MTAIGYVRQSKRTDLDLALSRDAQIEAISRMCGECEILEDMGRSGKGGGERLRPGYQRLVAGIKDGTYTEVYAIALSRFSRSVPELHGLMELAKAHGVRIVTAKEGAMDPHTATGRMIFNTWANFAEFVRDMAVEAANENVAVRRSRGERMGRVPYGDRPGDDPGAVVAAYREVSGSLNGTALLLNDRKVKSWAGVNWTGPAVRLVIKRLVPGVIPNNPKRGVKPSSPFLLYRLLRCPCGRVMTASRDGRDNREPIYRCHAADTLPDHQRPYRVRESVVLPWVKAEAARLRTPDRLLVLTANEAKRAALDARRGQVLDMYELQKIEREDFLARLRKIDDAIGMLETERNVVDIPMIDWSWTPKAINTVLASLWDYVELGPDLHPIRAEWMVPEWRA